MQTAEDLWKNALDGVKFNVQEVSPGTFDLGPEGRQEAMPANTLLRN